MPLSGNVKPFGLSDVKLTSTAGTQVDLPSAQTLMFRETVVSGELRGDDSLQAVVAISEGLEWELSAGGISPTAYALMTGRTVANAGTTPNQTQTLTAQAEASFPYFKIYGKSVGDSGDDVHVKIFKAKLTEPIEGTFENGEFFVTSCKGIGIDAGSDGVFVVVWNETATTLPVS